MDAYPQPPVSCCLYMLYKDSMKSVVADKLPCNFIYISKVKLATIVEGNPKAPFSIATNTKV